MNGANTSRKSESKTNRSSCPTDQSSRHLDNPFDEWIPCCVDSEHEKFYVPLLLNLLARSRATLLEDFAQESLSGSKNGLRCSEQGRGHPNGESRCRHGRYRTQTGRNAHWRDT